MPEAELLERIVSDLDFLKTKILSIEETIGEINNDLHHVKPEYIRKLESIKKEGTISLIFFKIISNCFLFLLLSLSSSLSSCLLIS